MLFTGFTSSLTYSLGTLTCLFGVLAGCGLQKSSSVSEQSFEAIVGGLDLNSADKNSQNIINSVVALYDEGSGEYCTGVLVADNVVLTAAHCVGSVPEALTIIFETEVHKLRPTRRFVDKAEVSPYWSTRRSNDKDRADIALLHFSGSMPTNYRPVKFLTKPELLVKGTRVLIAGYGVNDANFDLGAGILRAASMKIDDERFSASEISVDQRSNMGACRGDSGGPGFIEVNKQIYLWGVIARGISDSNRTCDQFAALTKTSAHAAWLERMIQKMSTPINSLERR